VCKPHTLNDKANLAIKALIFNGLWLICHSPYLVTIQHAEPALQDAGCRKIEQKNRPGTKVAHRTVSCVLTVSRLGRAKALPARLRPCLHDGSRLPARRVSQLFVQAGL
jgi:hypothetical protein